jgi:formylglycine-generating enzyme required for sulfatase activity
VFVNSPLNTPCDDGNPITADDFCEEGACKSGVAQLSPCFQDAHCAVWDNDTLCDGYYTCVDGTCDILPETVVACVDPDPTDCTLAACDPATGNCIDSTAGDSTPCDDGSACTSGDQCQGGTCAGSAVACDDGNPCTADSCDPATGCVFANDDTLPCDDGDLCSTLHVCVSGQCTGSKPLECDDGIQCTVDSCKPFNGCEHAADPALCADKGPCKEPLCDPVAGCKYTDATDGKACGDTANWACAAGVCTCTPSVCEAPDVICGTFSDGCGGTLTCGCAADDLCSPEGLCEWNESTCTGVECPALDGYEFACNSRGSCEYTNVDPTDWRQWDVWIYVPAGGFQMGCPPDPADSDKCLETGEKPSDELPQHPVALQQGYLIAKYEVVVDQYHACQTEDPGRCTTPSTVGNGMAGWGTNYWKDGPDPDNPGNVFQYRPTHPQNGLSFSQAQQFCSWLAPGGRVPTEAEWEFAASGPTHRKYPWGDGPEPTCSNNTAVFDEDNVGGANARPWGCNPCETSGCSGTSPAGSKPGGASAVGALDMAGNVFEWCEDRYHLDYVGAPSDFQAWYSGGSDRVVRGGSFNTGKDKLRSANRSPAVENNMSAHMGARCVRPLPATVCGAVTCPPLDGYDVVCNAKEHCEYYNQDRTGWRRWDVWVFVPPGTSTLGSPPGEQGHSWFEEGPGGQPLPITIEDGFFIAKYETPVAMLDACLLPWCKTDGEGKSPVENKYWGLLDHPANNITGANAELFCEWLIPGGRLPSEAEWEYAAKGMVHQVFPWGNVPAPDATNKMAVFKDSTCTLLPGGTAWYCPVDSRPWGASWVGALNMSGNAAEWVRDQWHDTYNGHPNSSAAWLDIPSAPPGVVRGGGLYDPCYGPTGSCPLRTANRSQLGHLNDPAERGFRCARSLKGPVCGGIECPKVEGYRVYCNAVDKCEYANWEADAHAPDSKHWSLYDTWILVPKGAFQMGSDNEGGSAVEQPVHTVTLANDFLIQKYEITTDHYLACYESPASACSIPETNSWNGLGWGTNSDQNSREDHPQNGLTWDQAKKFCEWVAPGGRLPTEAEWEYAASGPTHMKYPWGNAPEPDCDHANYNPYTDNQARPWACNTCTSAGCSGTQPVTYAVGGASSWSGARGMAGNVQEWCEDSWVPNYDTAPVDGSAVVVPGETKHVLRGGAFNNFAAAMRTAQRTASAPPNDRSAAIGARCVRPVPQP